jgi:hypothetical protein
VVYYANSLQRLAFKYLEHRLFFDYARGVMCHPDGPTYLQGDPQLLASWLHGCPHQGRLPDSIPQTPSNFRDCEIRQRFASRRMPTWVVGSRGRRAAVSI